jgi:hypothetical protein
VEDTPTILMLLEQESNAKSCASLGLRLEAGAVGWSRMPVESAVESGLGRAADYSRLPWGWLLEGRSARGEVSRSRMQKGSAGYFRDGFAAEPRVASEGEGIFKTRIDWDFFSLPIAVKRK